MFKTIDLCAGIGGIRKAFEITGYFKNIMSAEIDKYACLTYEHLFNENPYNDITSEEFKQKLLKINYDVLLAGFPCQSFSLAGKKEGFLDKVRGTIFFDIADILKRTKPKAFLLENVKGLISHDKGETFKTILNVLINELDYFVVGAEKNSNGEITYNKDEFLRNALNFGIPQKRERVYIVGFRKDIIKNKKVESIPKNRTDLKLYENLNSLIDFNNNPKYYLSEINLNSLKKHKEKHLNKGNGFGYEIVNDASNENPVANTILASGGSGKERNLIYDPQTGLNEIKIKGKKSNLNNEGIRVMTPIEWGKLQGFINYAFIENNIDTFSFPKEVSETQQYKQFGNSVCIPVVEEIAKYIYRYLKES